jgi:nitroreductase
MTMNESKKATTQVQIHELLATRWSPRAFDAARPVEREKIIALIEAARWAPSCFGDEPWRYLIGDRTGDPASWEKAFDCLGDSNKAWAKNAPVLILSCAGSVFRHNGKPNRHSQHDTGAASMALVLQAVALGMAAHQMAGFDAIKARELFAIPAEYSPMAMIAVGYQADPDILEGERREKEKAARFRQPIGANFFAGTWGVPIG